MDDGGSGGEALTGWKTIFIILRGSWSDFEELGLIFETQILNIGQKLKYPLKMFIKYIFT